jgi:hypothetical protein
VCSLRVQLQCLFERHSGWRSETLLDGRRPEHLNVEPLFAFDDLSAIASSMATPE